MSVLAIPALLVLSACQGSEPGNNPLEGEAGAVRSALSSSPVPSDVVRSESAERQGTPDLYEVTPDGITTAVNIPINPSLGELALACEDVKTALMAFGSVDGALAGLQDTGWNHILTITLPDGPWAEQTPQQQALVIEGLHAAANGEC